jgi:ribosomal protein S18 acetylase RimI-like enzyme
MGPSGPAQRYITAVATGVLVRQTMKTMPAINLFMRYGFHKQSIKDKYK